MEEENNSNTSSNAESSFASFMTPKTDKNEEKNGFNFSSKTKTDLDKKREEKEEEKNKELKEAKSNSIALANRYNKSYMLKAQTRNIIVFLPFIIIGIIIFLIIFFNGGNWLSKGINMLFNSMLNQ